MLVQPQAQISRTVPDRALIYYVAMTFAITWGLIGIYIFFPKQAASLLGEISGSHPIFFLATWAPAIAAFTLVLTHGGTSGLKAFLARLLPTRISPFWMTFLLLGVPLIYMAGSLFKNGPMLAPLPPEGIGPVIAVMVMMLFLGPIEEFGWRGVAQPLLQRHMAPIWAGILIGVTWGLWHLPAFFLSNTVFADWDFFPFFAGNIALAVLATPFLNNGRGSLFWPMLFHWQLINPFWPDAQPWDTWLFAAAALIVVILDRRNMFSRQGAVTEVIPKSGRTK